VFEIRIHGRGGQGVVTAAELLSVAAFHDGHYAQAFPSFGSERMGAPVIAYCRIDDGEIRTREPVVRPDALIIQDATLLNTGDSVFAGLRPGGHVLINSTRDVAGLELPDIVSSDRVVAVPATQIAVRHLGRPLPNAVLLGGIAALIDRVSLTSVLAAIRERFHGELADRNTAAAEEAFALVRAGREKHAHA
jgi:pyruvate ferredoxin oxidoreductase gamma subunit